MEEIEKTDQTFDEDDLQNQHLRTLLRQQILRFHKFERVLERHLKQDELEKIQNDFVKTLKIDPFEP